MRKFQVLNRGAIDLFAILLGISVSRVRPGDVRLRMHGTCFASKISLRKDSQMLSTSKSWKSLSVLALSLLLLPAVAQAQHYTQKNFTFGNDGDPAKGRAGP